MIAFRAETSLFRFSANTWRVRMTRVPEIRRIFKTEADLLRDPTNKTLTVRIHHLTQAPHDQVLEKLCAALNETQTVFPGTDLTLIKIGPSRSSNREPDARRRDWPRKHTAGSC